MRKLICTGIFFVFLFSISQAVYSVTFPTYWKMKFNDLEYFDPTISYPYIPDPNNPAVDPVGDEDNWGIANVSDIYDVLAGQLASPVWQEGDNGEHIRILFVGLDLAYWDDPNVPGQDNYYGMAKSNQGAYLYVYLWNENDINYTALSADVNNRSAFDSYNTITDGGTLLAKFEFTYGIDPNDSNIVVRGSTSTFSNPPTGTGEAFLKVVPNVGTMWEVFDQNSILDVLQAANISVPDPSKIDPEADMYVKFSYNPLYPTIGGFQLRSDDPAYGATPEPASIILMGSGLMLIGAAARKKFIKK